MTIQEPGAAGRTAVLFRTHFWDDFAQRQFDRLLRRAHGMDVYVLADETGGPAEGIRHDKIVCIKEAELLAMGLADAGEGNLLWFNGDYPLYRFAELYPNYDQYLQLEYDVVINVQLDEFAARAKALGADFVGITKGEPSEEWFWRDTCTGAYDLASLRHQLICLSLYSSRAMSYLFGRRLELSKAYKKGTLSAWPMCEGFIATELALAGMNCVELSAFGGTGSYDHWPPYLEADIGSMQGEAFVHPVLDPPRYIASLHKYRIGLAGYLNPVSAFHRKLRRLPVRDYAAALTSSLAAKAARTIGQARARRA